MGRLAIGLALLAASLRPSTTSTSTRDGRSGSKTPIRSLTARARSQGVAGIFARRGPDRAVVPVEALYGLLPKEQTKSGDLHLGALYNFNQETLTVPAFGAKLTLNLPTGVDSAGVDVGLKGLMTKSIGEVSVHLNAGYAFLDGTERGERDGRYELVVGASYPIGAPRHTRTMLVADLFTEQSVERGEDNVVGVEAGARYQLTPRIVFDAGIGTELAGPADRSSLFVTVGFSFGF